MLTGKFNVTVTDKVCVCFPDQSPSPPQCGGRVNSLADVSNDWLTGLWHVCVCVCVQEKYSILMLAAGMTTSPVQLMLTADLLT